MQDRTLCKKLLINLHRFCLNIFNGSLLYDTIQEYERDLEEFFLVSLVVSI